MPKYLLYLGNYKLIDEKLYLIYIITMDNQNISNKNKVLNLITSFQQEQIYILFYCTFLHMYHIKNMENSIDSIQEIQDNLRLVESYLREPITNQTPHNQGKTQQVKTINQLIQSLNATDYQQPLDISIDTTNQCFLAQINEENRINQFQKFLCISGWQKQKQREREKQKIIIQQQQIKHNQIKKTQPEKKPKKYISKPVQHNNTMQFGFCVSNVFNVKGVDVEVRYKHFLNHQSTSLILLYKNFSVAQIQKTAEYNQNIIDEIKKYIIEKDSNKIYIDQEVIHQIICSQKYEKFRYERIYLIPKSRWKKLEQYNQYRLGQLIQMVINKCLQKLNTQSITFHDFVWTSFDSSKTDRLLLNNIIRVLQKIETRKMLKTVTICCYKPQSFWYSTYLIREISDQYVRQGLVKLGNKKKFKPKTRYVGKYDKIQNDRYH